MAFYPHTKNKQTNKLRWVEQIKKKTLDKEGVGGLKFISIELIIVSGSSCH
jgi:hypothetical protein